MTSDTKIKLALVALMALTIAGGFYLWLSYHDTALLARAERARLIQERDEAKKAEQSALAQIEELKKIKDPQVIVREVPKYVPFHVESRPSALPGVSADGGGEVPPELVIPPGEIPSFWTYVQNCRECEVKLAARDAEVGNLEQQIKTLEKLKNRPWYKSPKLWFVVGAIGGAAAAGAAQ